uniref:UPF0725 protein n=1 Tax=Noccaea caerulescens TaxID=107243 RepID=A0A1J3FJ20_NOCCA
MSKQEEASGPLALTGLLAALPPYSLHHQGLMPSSPTTYDCRELVQPQPMESESYEYGCLSPEPMESESYEFGCLYSLPEYECCESPAYSPSQPLDFKWYTPYLSPIEPVCDDPYFETTELKKQPKKPYGENGLLAQIGIHCYNLLRGKTLQFVDSKTDLYHELYCRKMLLEVEDPIGNSNCYLDTEFCYQRASRMREEYRALVVTRCSLIQEEHCCENLVVDDFYEGDMPDWMPKDALTGLYKLQYYEMKESDVEQDKQWLHLYAQLALLFLGFYPDNEKTEPFELTNVVVQTKEDVESKNKARAKNAIFYISFKCSGGQDYKAILRRTTMDWPHHMAFEVKCVM